MAREITDKFVELENFKNTKDQLVKEYKRMIGECNDFLLITPQYKDTLKIQNRIGIFTRTIDLMEKLFKNKEENTK